MSNAANFFLYANTNFSLQIIYPTFFSNEIIDKIRVILNSQIINLIIHIRIHSNFTCK